MKTRGGFASNYARPAESDRSVVDKTPSRRSVNLSGDGHLSGVNKSIQGNSEAYYGGKRHAASAFFEKHEGKKCGLLFKACRAAVYHSVANKDVDDAEQVTCAVKAVWTNVWTKKKVP